MPCRARRKMLKAKAARRIRAFLGEIQSAKDLSVHFDFWNERCLLQVMDAAVRKEDVEELLQLVLWTFPQLSDPGAIETMGFPKRAARVLCARLGRDGFSDSSDMSETLSSFLDEQAWVEMRAYLLEAVSAQQPPTKDSLFNVKKPWGLAMRSFLGSKHVRLNGSTLAMCNLLGLAELPPMWRAAQALRKSAHSESESGIVTWFAHVCTAFQA